MRALHRHPLRRPAQSGATRPLPPAVAISHASWRPGPSIGMADVGLCVRIGARALSSPSATATPTPIAVAMFTTAAMSATAPVTLGTVSYTHLRAHETRHDLVC